MNAAEGGCLLDLVGSLWSAVLGIPCWTQAWDRGHVSPSLAFWRDAPALVHSDSMFDGLQLEPSI